MQRYNPKDFETKWQDIWDQTGTYTADLQSNKPKYIAMSMFNYPSGAGIHIGHAMNYTISDVKARFKRQQGFESYHPVGWDAFGLPAENYAIKAGVSPQESMAKIIPDYHRQYKAMGWSNDWEKEIATHLPEYYKWTQWIFWKMHEQGLAYQASRMQWWCEKDATVLANEQVIDGKCWRHDGPDDPLVEKKEIKQWFFKITDYADELLEATDSLDWTESVKLAQKNWIGKSSGAEVVFPAQTTDNFVLLHGFKANSTSNFHPWLKQTLEQAGAKVYVPDLPNNDKPDAKEQASFVLQQAILDENTVLLGHSYGSVSALRIVEQLDKPIKKLVIVAGFAEPSFKDGKRVFETTTDWDFDFEKIKANVKEIVYLRDASDYAVPAERADFLHDKLGAHIIDFTAQKNHVTAKVEPVVLEHVLPSISVFTVAHDTMYGTTFLVLAPEHELVERLTTDAQRQQVEDYRQAAEKKSEVERQANKDKTGVFTGAFAINPLNGQAVPVWIADYVLAGYGTGAVMGVPGEDGRDYEFAQKFGLNIVYTTEQQEFLEYHETIKKNPAAYKLANSAEFDGLDFQTGRQRILEKLVDLGVGQEKVNYRMNDWSVGRQRYWGAPIPIIHCEKCGPVLVPEKELPVVLPELTDFQPSGDGRSALARATDWLAVDCPECGGPGERETDTLDTYICSSWYMYRYFDPRNQEQIFNSAVVKKWEPIDFYNGADHATAHLLYARFVGHFFKKIGLIDNPEPFKQFLFNGKVAASDGSAFSKSKGNGIDPLEIINQGYGADALRTFLMFAAPLELGARWDPQGVPGTHRFLSRLWNVVQEYLEAPAGETSAAQTKELLRISHQTIKKMTDDIETNSYNTAIAAAMTMVNDLYKQKVIGLDQSDVWKQTLETIVALVAPFAPHTAEELWQQLGHSITVHRDTWPEFDAHYVAQDTVTIAVQVNGKVRAEIQIASNATQEAVISAAKVNDKIQAYINGTEIIKEIYVPGRIVNLVVK